MNAAAVPSLFVVLLVFANSATTAQAIAVRVSDPSCVPLDRHAAVSATLSGDDGAAFVRLYFRRLHHEVEDFYYAEMRAAGGGAYWGVFPDPSDHRPQRRALASPEREDTAWAEWWRAKEASDHRDPGGDLDRAAIRERASVGGQQKRDWMGSFDDPALQRWLEGLENEPVEYYVAAFDRQGALLARSPMKVVPVVSACQARLTPEQAGTAANLTVGETAPWQRSEAPFHWECDGLVARVDASLVRRADEVCRAAAADGVPAWIPATAAGGTLLALALLEDDDAPEASPSRP